MHILFSKKVLTILRKSTKHANLRVQYPLKLSNIHSVKSAPDINSSLQINMIHKIEFRQEIMDRDKNMIKLANFPTMWYVLVCTKD